MKWHNPKIIDETINPNRNPFLIFNLLNRTPLKNSSSDIGAMMIAANSSKIKSKGLLEPVAISDTGNEIELISPITESNGKNTF